jgi:hypothetical protein
MNLFFLLYLQDKNLNYNYALFTAPCDYDCYFDFTGMQEKKRRG